MGSPTWLSSSRGANDQAQRYQGTAAASDMGTLSPYGAGVRGAHGSRSTLPGERANNSSVAAAMAERWCRGVGTRLPASSAPPGAAEGASALRRLHTRGRDTLRAVDGSSPNLRSAVGERTKNGPPR